MAARRKRTLMQTATQIKKWHGNQTVESYSDTTVLSAKKSLQSMYRKHIMSDCIQNNYNICSKVSFVENQKLSK